MAEWWSYTVADFLMYAPRTWYRLVERYNESAWPFHLLMLVVGLGITAMVARPRPLAAFTVLPALALAWAWVAIAFLWRHYAGISTGGRYFAVAFMVEALLLAPAGIRSTLTFEPPGTRVSAWFGLGLLLVAVVWYPVAALLSGRGPAGAEVFGIMPDPTAIGTIGVLFAARGRWRYALLVVPVLWCVASGAMTWAMHQQS